MTPAEALWRLHSRGWTALPPRDDGQVRFQAPGTDATSAEARAALAVLSGAKEETRGLLRWPPDSWGFTARFGHPDALLYPFLGREVDTPAGPGVLQQVAGGRAVVLRPGADRAERVPVGAVTPPREVATHAG